jgi:polyhydroxybutyrate depolymerase
MASSGPALGEINRGTPEDVGTQFFDLNFDASIVPPLMERTCSSNDRKRHRRGGVSRTMQTKWHSTLLLVGLVAGSCYGTDPLGYEFSKEEGDGELGIWVHSGLYNREYELHTPPNVDDGQLHPLIVFLHGAGDTGPGFHRLLDPDERTDAGGFITVWPSGMEGTWSVGCANDCTIAEALEAHDEVFLGTLVRHLAEGLPVDTTRVYLLGYSQGGQLAQLFACTSALPPAGIGVVAAEMYKAAAQTCAPNGRFPVGILHGDADPIAFYGGFGPEAVVLSVPETVQVWLSLWGCSDDPIGEFRPDSVGDFTSATIYRFPDCGATSPVVLYRIHNGGHTWPGDTGPWPPILGTRSRNLDATHEFLSLFASVAAGG